MSIVTASRRALYQQFEGYLVGLCGVCNTLEALAEAYNEQVVPEPHIHSGEATRGNSFSLSAEFLYAQKH